MVKSHLSLLEKFSLFINIYGQLFAGIFRFSWWSPFFLYSLFQLMGYAMFLWYYAPVWINITRPLLSLILPPQAFHYPQYYLAMPSVYAGFESFILGPTVWVILFGAAVFRLNGIFVRQKPPLRDGIRASLKRYPALLLVWFLETILVLLILAIPSVLIQEFTRESPNMAAAVAIVLQGASLIVTAMLIYAVPGIILDNKRAGEAIGDSVLRFFRNPILTYSIVLIPSFLRIILNILMTDYAPRIISMLNPDLIPVLLFVYIITGIFVNLFIYGAAVFTYRSLE